MTERSTERITVALTKRELVALLDPDNAKPGATEDAEQKLLDALAALSALEAADRLSDAEATLCDDSGSPIDPIEGLTVERATVDLYECPLHGRQIRVYDRVETPCGACLAIDAEWRSEHGLPPLTTCACCGGAMLSADTDDWREDQGEDDDR